MPDATVNRAQPTECGSIKWEGRRADGLLCSRVCVGALSRWKETDELS